MSKTPVEVTQQYAQLFNEGKHAEMGQLYAPGPDTLWSRPGTPDVTGGAEIAAHYASPEHSAGTTGLQITQARYFTDGNAVAAEFVFEGNGRTSHVIDLFEINDEGLISSMNVFFR
jgi:limonene-1,2-epoxide hydrolase